jgi:hypothetical protein
LERKVKGKPFEHNNKRVFTPIAKAEYPLKNNGQLSESSYIYVKGQLSHVSNSQVSLKSKLKVKKSKAERLEIKHKTKNKLVGLLYEVGEKKIADSMALCWSYGDVLTCGQHIVSETPNHRCNVRFCVICANRRSNKYNKKYLPYTLAFVKLSPVKLTPCLLTLTQVKIKGESLKKSRERILKSFRNMIRKPFFKDYFEGGLFTVENTVSDEGNHTHIHSVVFRKRFIDEKLLKREWANVSEGAKNLNIKLIDDLESGLREVIKYVSKPLDIEKFEKKHLLELLEIKGKQMIGTFGKFREFCRTHELEVEAPKEEKPKLEEGNCCFHCNDNSPLYRVRMTANQKIDFYKQIEQVRGSPPTQNH